MTLIVLASVLTAYELISILYKFSPDVLKRALGYDVWIDIFFGGVLTIAAASTGAMGALIIAVVTGFFISITLMTTKKFIGYQKYEKNSQGKRVWVEYPPTTTANSVGSALYNMGVWCASKAKAVINGFSDSAKATTNA